MDRRLRKALKGLMDPDLERRRRAMESFVRTTFERFIRCLYRYLGNEVECEDVLEDVYAIKITDYDQIKAAGVELIEVAERVFDIYLYQIFENGFFHWVINYK